MCRFSPKSCSLPSVRSAFLFAFSHAKISSQNSKKQRGRNVSDEFSGSPISFYTSACKTFLQNRMVSSSNFCKRKKFMPIQKTVPHAIVLSVERAPGSCPVHAGDSILCFYKKGNCCSDQMASWPGKLSEFQQAFYRGPPSTSNLLSYYACKVFYVRRAQSSCQLREFTLVYSRKGIRRSDQMASWPGKLSEFQQAFYRGPPNTSNLLSYYACKVFQVIRAQSSCQLREFTLVYSRKGVRRSD